VDFALTDEQRLIQDTVGRSWTSVSSRRGRDDIEHKLDLELIEGWPSSAARDRDPGGVRRRGLDFVAEALSCEEIERGEARSARSSRARRLNSLSLLRYGTEDRSSAG
jgi:hypothetical protein